MMKNWKSGLIALGLLIMLPLHAAESLEGQWTTVDDATGKKRALVNISISQGVLNGTILRVYPQPGDTGVCHHCPGAFKGKPIQGLTILWGLKAESDGSWGGGEILDPKNGKVYKVTLKQDGNKLHVRGYLGFKLLGRTQTWVR